MMMMVVGDPRFLSFLAHQNKHTMQKNEAEEAEESGTMILVPPSGNDSSIYCSYQIKHKQFYQGLYSTVLNSAHPLIIMLYKIQSQLTTVLIIIPAHPLYGLFRPSLKQHTTTTLLDEHCPLGDWAAGAEEENPLLRMKNHRH